jgi:hypothetical protein
MVARDLRQALRTGRMIFLLVVLAVLLGLLILGIGSAFGMTKAPASFGAVLFQIFFSLAYFVVAIVGPAVAAVGLSSEKDGRTWEALVLTGADVRAIAGAKFRVAAIAVLAFLTMITPVSLLCLFLGGVTVAEVVMAFVLLAIIAIVAVAYGVSVGAAAGGTGSATLVAMASALIGAPGLYVAVGLGMSFFAHATWPEVPSFSPVWLPSAYARGHFDGWYVVLLIALPIALVVQALWFSYELTIARLKAPAEDRSSGLKRWYLASVPIMTAIAAIPGYMTRGSSRLSAWIGGLGGLFVFLVFAAFVFANDALAASRRVEFAWQKRNAGWPTRVLGPGLVQTFMLILVSGLVALASYSIVGAAVLAKDTPRGAPLATSVALLSCCEYWSAFFAFLLGFLVWARVRADSAGGARVLTLMIGAVALAAPWIAFVAFGFTGAKRIHDTMVVASPSPGYALVMANAIESGEPHVAMTAGLACSLGWMAMGLVLFGLGARRATRLVAERRTERANLEARIAHEAPADILPPPETAAPTGA